MLKIIGMSNKYKKRNIFAIALMGFARLSVGASDFDAIVASLLGNDRQLELSQRQMEASVAALNATNVLEDPEIGYEFKDNGAGVRAHELTVSQSFEWLGVYSARNKQIELERAGLQYENEAERNEQRLKLRTLLVDIIAANQTIDRLATAVEGCDKLLATLEADYQRGDVSILDVNKMRIELADFKLKMQEAQSNKEALMAELQSTVVDAEALAATSELPEHFPLIEMKTMEQYVGDAKAADPTLLGAKNNALVAKARRSVASRSTLPGFSVGYLYSLEDGDSFNGFTLGVNVPLWRASKERKAAAAEETATMFGERVEEIKLEKKIEATYNYALNLKETLSQYGKALVVSDNIGLLQRAYEAGTITLTEFVLDVNFFVEADVQYIELQRQYYNALVELTRYEKNIGG